MGEATCCQLPSSWLTDPGTVLLTMSRRDLAARSGLSPKTVDKILEGAWWPGPRQLRALAQGSGLRIGEVAEVLLPINLGRITTWSQRYKETQERRKVRKETDETKRREQREQRQRTRTALDRCTVVGVSADGTLVVRRTSG